MPQSQCLAYPLRIGPNGNLETQTGIRLIEEQIRSVLETKPFERVYRADYGFDGKIFDLVEPNAIHARIINAIKSQVAGVRNIRVVGDNRLAEDGTYHVTILYDADGVSDTTPLEIDLQPN